jgi:hypothetical protein
MFYLKSHLIAAGVKLPGGLSSPIKTSPLGEFKSPLCREELKEGVPPIIRFQTLLFLQIMLDASNIREELRTLAIVGIVLAILMGVSILSTYLEP